MSHVATAWALKQRGLKPATRVVLWALADCHNPAAGCFPTQAYLADACEMARSTVNLHLDILESRGLLRRTTSVDERTRRQRPTRYHLGFEIGQPSEAATAVSENKTRAVSENRTVPCPKTGPGPCPKNGKSRVRKSDTNLVIEPVKEKIETRKRARTAIQHDSTISQTMLEAARNRGLPDDEARAQFERFRDRAIAKGDTYIDWNAAWRNWLSSPYFRPINSNRTTGGRSDSERFDEHIEALKARVAVQRLE